ncbi:tRNA (adenosine(37)-N6)-threonylcarbamoyltransferase complex dimerization subunit type 1 TsaB [Sphingorhabdus sp. 109]|jgi:tRNA threonylcarbamoyl adenosine modification protein YeaZ|uniref:tRNA (adenosine(37)-N6)-threonylcarbamoyltransferase complex dimerization subunit type 1 TsaB n=1 Tax=Sphingorhabdus sp. 109 TaxID=2653173 RepID=UPI0012F3CC4C|nr:tRNA (adenosine(37)-N6)-threonylcarbamoyltransferase complex dimerization subunit type 1 TsaB [Sphingorhabdus sp. 109]VWX57511.1 tRNA threonylcarbamoyladenosine biosynthesis protein TsaB [Sphingorhabdus sp. 109]
MGERLLAIDTASPACSVALFENGALIAASYAEIGRGHAEKLVPAIAKLPDRGKADKILVNCGPGSFTGVRIGISAAKALALAWGSDIHGYNCLALVAAQALDQLEQPEPICVAMLAGHGQYFVQNYCANGKPAGDFASLTPEQAVQEVRADVIAGSAATELATLAGSKRDISILPNAAHIFLVAEDMKNMFPKPDYGRKPDAKPTKTG